MKMAHKVFPNIEGEKGVMEIYFGNPGKGSHDDVFDAGLRGCGHRDGVSVATQARGYP
jgi:hypothetical protein